jgi:molecular chaperone DnaK
LSDEEVEKMKQDAEAHAEDDKKKKELIEAKNHANSVAFEIEKQLEEYGDKLEVGDKDAIAENVKKLKELAAKDDVTKEELDSATEEMFKSAQKIGEAMQKAQAQGGAAGTGGGTDTQGESAESGEGESSKGGSENSKTQGAEEGEVVNE